MVDALTPWDAFRDRTITDGDSLLVSAIFEVKSFRDRTTAGGDAAGGGVLVSEHSLQKHQNQSIKLKINKFIEQ